MFDAVELNFDMDGDGIADSYAEAVDMDGDGIADALAMDTDGNGIFDTVVQAYDLDADGVFDTFETLYDSNEDGVYDAEELYNYNAEDGTLELVTMEEVFGAYGDSYEDPYDIDNFDPDGSNPEDVSGDPAQSMEEWEFQGDTNRCAIYSQKFVIDELTGQDMDIEELADLAEENGWFTEEGGTPLMHMNKILDYYGIENEMSFHNDIDDLKECLDAGGKAIVSLDSGEVWEGETDDLFDPSDGADHAVEVIGIDYSDPDDPMVILNDSGHPDGCGELVPMDTFLDAWEDGNCQMIACM